MKRLFIISGNFSKITGFFMLACLHMQCQNCQDITTNDAAAYIKFAFFLDDTQTSPTVVQITQSTLANFIVTDTISDNSIKFLLPSNTTNITYGFKGTYVDADDITQSFDRTITVDFNRKISILRPDCGVTEDITLTSATDAVGSIELANTGMDTTTIEGNVKIFLK